MTPPTRIFIDTNVYINGAANRTSPAGTILQWIGYDAGQDTEVEVLVSKSLFDQILRVGRRLNNKDWGSLILAQLWKNVTLVQVMMTDEEIETVIRRGTIPREDVEMYLTASLGRAECFISSNHVLIRALCEQTGEFACLTPEEFVDKYLK